VLVLTLTHQVLAPVGLNLDWTLRGHYAQRLHYRREGRILPDLYGDVLVSNLLIRAELCELRGRSLVVDIETNIRSYNRQSKSRRE